MLAWRHISSDWKGRLIKGFTLVSLVNDWGKSTRHGYGLSGGNVRLKIKIECNEWTILSDIRIINAFHQSWIGFPKIASDLVVKTGKSAESSCRHCKRRTSGTILFIWSPWLAGSKHGPYHGSVVMTSSGGEFMLENDNRCDLCFFLPHTCIPASLPPCPIFSIFFIWVPFWFKWWFYWPEKPKNCNMYNSVHSELSLFLPTHSHYNICIPGFDNIMSLSSQSSWEML